MMVFLRHSVAVAFLLFSVSTAMAAGVYAPAAFEPPVTTKAALEGILHALPPEVTAQCLEAIVTVHWFDDLAGQNKALEAASRAGIEKVLEIGREIPLALDAAALFDAPPLLIDGFHYFMAAVASRDAYQIALEADLANLRPGDEVFVIDPQAARAFGPIDRPRSAEGFAWLPMAGGDTAVLAVRSVYGTPPDIVITALSHGYIDLAAELAKDALPKVASCNNHIACETNPEVEFLSSGVGRYTFSRGGGTSLCSGALINVPGTAALEPYFLTANHCVSTQALVETMQIWWDYRASTCAGGGVPTLGSLPTSLGVNLLGASSTYDHTLAQLNSVPTGAFGRAYLGWDTTAPAAQDDLICIHHPVGSAMRISYGYVTDPAMSSTSYPSYIRVEWEDGVTEGGSSGSPLMMPSRNHTLIGVLYGGAVHVCPEDPVRNWDYYAPFRLFYPTVANLLDAQDGGGTQPSSLDMVGPAQWNISGSSLTMQVNRITNDGGASGTLRMRLWASTGPFTGQLTNGHPIGTATLGGLAAGASFVNISRTVPYAEPAYGTYRLTLLLEEQTGAGAGFVLADYLPFPGTHTLGTPGSSMHGPGFKHLEPYFRETMFPVPDSPGSLARIAPDGEAALRLTATGVIAPDSIAPGPIAPDLVWATVEWLGLVEPAEVRWHPVGPDPAHDGWAIVRVPDGLPEGAVVTVEAGALTELGAAVNAIVPFEIDPAAAGAESTPTAVEVSGVSSLPGILAAPVSPVYRIEPMGLYDSPETIRIPLPAGARAADLRLHYRSAHPEHGGWRSSDRVVGWLASDARAVQTGGMVYLEFEVTHGGFVQLGRVQGAKAGSLGVTELRMDGSPGRWAALLVLLTLAMAAVIVPGRRPRAVRAGMPRARFRR